jgi:hypothetical protein
VLSILCAAFHGSKNKEISIGNSRKLSSNVYKLLAIGTKIYHHLVIKSVVRVNFPHIVTLWKGPLKYEYCMGGTFRSSYSENAVIFPDPKLLNKCAVRFVLQ